MENSKQLVDITVDKITEYIIANKLQANDKLPVEAEFCSLFSIGRGTLREAIKILVSRNILEVKQGSGTFVKKENFGVPNDPLGFSLISDKKKLTLDLLEIRLALEPRIAGIAALNRSEKDLKKMYELMSEVEELIKLDIDHSNKDIELHKVIAQSSKNLVVPNLMPIIHEAISLFTNLTSRALKEETIVTHREIIDAIAEKNSLKAQESMQLHIFHNRRNLLINFENNCK